MSNSHNLRKGDKVSTPHGSGTFIKMEYLDDIASDRYVIKIDDKKIAKQYARGYLYYWFNEIKGVK